jgi:hypothetical protein
MASAHPSHARPSPPLLTLYSPRLPEPLTPAGPVQTASSPLLQALALLEAGVPASPLLAGRLCLAKARSAGELKSARAALAPLASVSQLMPLSPLAGDIHDCWRREGGGELSCCWGLGAALAAASLRLAHTAEAARAARAARAASAASAASAVAMMSAGLEPSCCAGPPLPALLLACWGGGAAAGAEEAWLRLSAAA